MIFTLRQAFGIILSKVRPGSSGHSDKSVIKPIQTLCLPPIRPDCKLQEVFGTPHKQLDFLKAVVRAALAESEKPEGRYTEKLLPIRDLLKKTSALKMPDPNTCRPGSGTRLPILSITMDTPTDTLKLIFGLINFWFDLIGIEMYMTFDIDHLKVAVNPEKFKGLSAGFYSVDYFARPFPQGRNLPVDVLTLCEYWKTPTFASLWSIFFGASEWVNSVGKIATTDYLPMPSPVMPRFYIGRREEFLWVRVFEELGKNGRVNRKVLFTTFSNGQNPPMVVGNDASLVPLSVPVSAMKPWS